LSDEVCKFFGIENPVYMFELNVDYLIENPDTVIKKLGSLDHIKLITPRISFSAMVSTGDNSVAVYCQGINPDEEKILSSIDNIKRAALGLSMEKGSNLTGKDRFSVILGRGLAKSIGVKPGDSIVLLANTVGGSINAFDMTVKGTFFTSFKEFDDRALRMPIDIAKQLIRTDGIQTLVVVLDKTSNTSVVKNEILNTIKSRHMALEIRTWKQLADFYNKTVELYGRQFFVLKLIITIIVVLSIFNTINMAIWERTREIGTIMAMGYKKMDIMKLFLAEGMILGLLGGIAGIIAGIAAARIISFFGIPMPPPPGATVGWTAFIKVVPDLLVSSMIISVSASLLSSFYPAFKASNMVITDALRHY
jgi:putative ABC transport system permease protein